MEDVSAMLIDGIDERVTREPVLLKEFVESGTFGKLRPPFIWGTHSIFHTLKRHKYVELDSWRYTTTEIARAYLRHIFKEQSSRKRVGFDRRTFTLLDVPPPYYFGGAHKGYLSLVDISQCYYQLYSPLTLDVKFDPWCNYVGLGQVSFLYPDWLATQRKSMKRVIGGGVIHADKLRIYNGKEIVERPNFNKLLAPELWGLQMFTLHYIAREVVKLFGAYYWNVDGCIVDPDKAQDVMDYLAEEWNLLAVEKLGPGRGEVRGVGSYDILPHKGGHRFRTAPSNNFHKVSYDPGLRGKLKAIRRATVDYL